MSLQDLAALATAIGVALAAWQLYLAKQQAQLAFEDSLNSQYRSLLAELPLKAMLGRQLTQAELLAPGSLLQVLRPFQRAGLSFHSWPGSAQRVEQLARGDQAEPGPAGFQPGVAKHPAGSGRQF